MVHLITKSPSQITINDLVNETAPTDREGRALIEAVVGEPYFATSLFPWHNLHIWYAFNALRSVCTPDCVVVPGTAELMSIAGKYIHHLISYPALVGGVVKSGCNICWHDYVYDHWYGADYCVSLLVLIYTSIGTPLIKYVILYHIPIELLIVSYVTELMEWIFALIFCAVSFEDLYSLRAPVGTVDRFDISAFDRRVSESTL